MQWMREMTMYGLLAFSDNRQALRAIDTAIMYGFDDAATVLLVESEMDIPQEDLDVRYFDFVV